MADKIQPGQTPRCQGPNEGSTWFVFTCNNTSDPAAATIFGPGAALVESIAYAATGDYLVTLKGSFYTLRAVANWGGDSAKDAHAHTFLDAKAQGGSTASSFKVTTRDDALAPEAQASGEVTVQMLFSNQ